MHERKKRVRDTIYLNDLCMRLNINRLSTHVEIVLIGRIMLIYAVMPVT